MAFAFLFPGQGSQSLKMMDGFADLPVVQHTFAEASDTLSLDLWAMLQADGADEINATVNTQPIMLAAGYATYLAWQELNGKQPSIVAGHSLGEYTALVAAGALPFAEAVKLVRLRAEAMQAAVPAGVGAMAAILSLSDDDIRAACAEAAQSEVVEAVNFNSPGQVVIAGNKGAVERAMDLCKAKGAKRALPLPVSVPSHCSLMRPAAERLAEALQGVHLSAPAIPVLHNADVASYNDASQIRDALTRQLYMPVRWTETIQKLAADGVTMMAECGPGKVLAGLAKRIDGNVKCLALTDRAALEAARAELV
ncbi:ACP S-malonyltransferase [Chromobacterium vaccinii]|uniref:Malonyl CoA-acyl carrier protein transacylase n=1 Tax=Chromobacterium vaccinii TaxID=1108595 RepID=A0A1D9LFG5_9NEIS|nr:ACP S-malonyltransferase [Chromobacterium vaccinii]AOZ49914.1 [acyl-carrier-protein] S-malonyltransferase [Chromobacterium vaccinii]QND83969.1 Malonyl CoA-acyl carrier protein transacylase [Chromobacterium vaccinii]QND89200.1 Malonyl CoA-acyl carrier protein transacylase [Chromobacterium vaccinii]